MELAARRPSRMGSATENLTCVSITFCNSQRLLQQPEGGQMRTRKGVYTYRIWVDTSAIVGWNKQGRWSRICWAYTSGCCHYAVSVWKLPEQYRESLECWETFGRYFPNAFYNYATPCTPFRYEMNERQAGLALQSPPTHTSDNRHLFLLRSSRTLGEFTNNHRNE